MVLQVLSIFDKALGAYSRPMFVPSRGVAVRSFQDELNDPKSEFSRHPTDYELYHVGEYNDEIGRFFQPENLELVCRGSDLVKEVKS